MMARKKTAATEVATAPLKTGANYTVEIGGKKYDRRILDYATPTQRLWLEAAIDMGGIRPAARALKLDHSSIAHALTRVIRKAARAGVQVGDPELDHSAPPGYHSRGTSTLVDAAGNVVMRWHKTAKDKDDRAALLMEAIEDMGQKLPREPKIKAPRCLDADLLCIYPMGDPHVGMFSWRRETGANFDLKIAERNLIEAADMLVDLAPPAETAIVINLGDFFHSDNNSNKTARSGHSLDVDGRWPKVLGVGIRIMCRIIERALEKHRKVIVRCEIGNHDDHTAVMLAVALSHHYKDNPRVEIDTSPAKFWYHEFGNNLFGSTHLDTVKPADLPGVMAVDQREAWGRTEHRRWYTGHEHHERVKEYPGCVVETFRTLAPGDAWHTAAGYRSGRDMRLDVHHRQHGLINRHIVGIGQLAA